MWVMPVGLVQEWVVPDELSWASASLSVLMRQRVWVLSR